jgi:hypothetical protein
MHVPVWPIAALVVVAVATTITLRAIDDARPARPVTTVQDAAGYWDSTVGHPASPRLALRPLLAPGAFEVSTAAVRERPAGPFHATGRAHEVLLGPDASAFGPILGDPDAWVTGVAANAPRATNYTDCIHCMQRR